MHGSKQYFDQVGYFEERYPVHEGDIELWKARDLNDSMSNYSVVPDGPTSLGTEASATTGMTTFVSRIQTK